MEDIKEKLDLLEEIDLLIASLENDDTKSESGDQDGE